MKLTEKEIHFLAAWGREVLENAWTGPAHRLRKKHAVREMDLITLIAAWAIVNRKPEVAIADIAVNTLPIWPWNSPDELRSRVQEAMQSISRASSKRNARQSPVR